MRSPRRGEIWYAYLDPTVGREQAGRRPVLVVSANELNAGPSELVIVLPITSRDRGIPSHIALTKASSGLEQDSVVICEAIRSVSRRRLRNRAGAVDSATLAQVELVLGDLIGL